MGKKGLPAGAMVEVTSDLIGEGSFTREINESIKEAYAALAKRKEAGSTGGSCKISAEITLAYDPDMPTVVEIRHSVKMRTPKNEVVTLVKEKNGRLLAQPSGTSEDHPDQQRLFDAAGRPIGIVDKNTGELVEENPVAGRVGV